MKILVGGHLACLGTAVHADGYLVLQPEECGGPLTDLDGHVVGLDIAPSGRVESLAIPAADLKSLLAEVTKGKFLPARRQCLLFT